MDNHSDNIDIDSVRPTQTNGADNLSDIEFVYTIDEFNRCVLREYGPFENDKPLVQLGIDQGDATKDLGERRSDGLVCGDEKPDGPGITEDLGMDCQLVEGDERNKVEVSGKVIEEDIRGVGLGEDFETLEMVPLAATTSPNPNSVKSFDDNDDAFQCSSSFGSPLSFGSTDCDLEYVDSTRIEYEYEEKNNSRSSSRQSGQSSPLEEVSFEVLDANGVQFLQHHPAKSEDWERGEEEEDAEKDEMEIEALVIDDDDDSNDGKDEDVVVVLGGDWKTSEKSIITSKGLLTTLPSTLPSSVPQTQTQNQNQNQSDEIIKSQTVRIAILESSLEETNSQLLTEIASNRVKIERLRSSLLEKTQMEEREKELVEVRKEREVLKDQIKEREERLKALEAVVETEREEREALKEQIKERDGRLEVLEVMLKMEREEREKEDEESGTRTTQLEERISFMEHDIAVKVSTINVLAGQLENARRQVDDYEAVLKAKVRSIQSLEQETMKMRIDLKEKDKKLESRRLEKRELEQQVDVLKKEVEKEKANSESCRVQLKVVRDETSGLREKLGTAEENIKKWVAASKMKDGELLAVNKRHQMLRREMELQGRALEVMTDRAREVEDWGAQYEIEMNSYVADMKKNWESKVAMKSQEAENWRNKLVTVEAQLARQTQELKKLKEDVSGCERRCEKYRAERDELREKNQTLEYWLAGYQQSYQRHSGF
ncbi:hypothetical protein K435DRAFT_895879 [Dendrothele bispora CBS 962.96]|uniref:Uncharacterized protein n=1 Tax=Dendrothele bispora (strain CBS 962.96) TaxID=1314807 RepID=A0A4S8KN10_DENBC|nr:hypothetical protein K435DRAFT_895879 [Dendrothele bispora CBS 962.96]